jgi:hypothetical protein
MKDEIQIAKIYINLDKYTAYWGLDKYISSGNYDEIEEVNIIVNGKEYFFSKNDIEFIKAMIKKFR